MKIYVVGLGPGGPEQMTNRAQEALKASDILVGYTLYIDLIKDQFPDKKLIATPMKKEVDRCRTAVEKALEGATVAVVSSGDAGVYGMAGIVLELAEPYPFLEVEVIPGITAACSGAAVLGAPLIHDFAVISLSDLLTPWEKIEARLAAAAQGDFVIVLYNPSSIKRHDYLKKACDIVMRHQNANLPSGIVRSIGREGENYEIVSSLTELREKKVDMFTTVIIGNSQTRVINNKLVTPRGYRK
ncbi:precorrin-3B C(17)-methyltransferase [Dehalobacter sp. TBBPA1]|uniref:precorrin-3B C(17)-methyltransferase n=1 Tax=Dehalobacter sp. TBBPA1 TaxID=3235037 RepID=UPI0034A41F65